MHNCREAGRSWASRGDLSGPTEVARDTGRAAAMTENLVDLLITHVWWSYSPPIDGFSRLYRAMNVIEGAAWLVFSGLVFARWVRFRRSRWELVYALAFVTFGLSDFREAFILESWLLFAKLVNLIGLFLLRRAVMRRFYPTSKVY